MVDKKRTQLRKRRYLAAFVITALIFVLGFLAGLVIESQRTAYLAEAYNQQRIEYSSLQVQQQLIEEITRDEDCQALQKIFEQNINNLESARLRLETFQDAATLRKGEFEMLAREYTHAQIRYYLLAQRNQELCGKDAATILYFYTETADCPRCEDQAFVLTYLKRLAQDKLLIFSFNEQLAEQEPSIQLLVNRYAVEEYPSIVINNELRSGFTPRNDILEEICGWYQEEHSFCN